MYTTKTKKVWSNFNTLEYFTKIWKVYESYCYMNFELMMLTIVMLNLRECICLCCIDIIINEYIYINISYVWDYSTVVLLNLETLNKYNNNVKQFTKSHRICSLKMLTSGGSFFGTSCSISMLTSFVWYFVVFYFFMGGMKHWCDWDWGGGGHPGLPWAESFPNSRRDHIISTSNQNSQGYIKAFLISWLKMLTLFSSLSFKSLSYEKHMRSRCRFSMVVHDTMHLSAVLM